MKTCKLMCVLAGAIFWLALAASPMAVAAKGNIPRRPATEMDMLLIDVTAETRMRDSAVMTYYLPLICQGEEDPRETWLTYVNYFRSQAGVPIVTQDSMLNNNCWEHARYMAENNHLTHNQDPTRPYASDAGQSCAQHSDAWLGSDFPVPIWEPYHAIEGWMQSPDHRLWLLYPTTPTFGFGFYAAANNRAGAALDVLSKANFSADASYTGWPVKYPAPNQIGIPPTKFPITIFWPYFGPTPILSSAGLTTQSGVPIAHSTSTDSAVGHEVIKILPADNLPDNTVFVVTVAGRYNGIPFSYAWKFSTGDEPIL